MPVILQNLIEIINASVEMFLIFLYFSLLSSRRVGKAGYIIAYLLSVAALSASVLLTDELLLSLFITLGILTAVAFYCFEDTIRRRILMIALYMLIISVADPLVIGLLCLANLGSPQDFLESGIGRYLGMIATDLIYLWLIGIMHRLINKRIKDLPVKYWILIITIPIISIFILRNQIDMITASTMAINYFSLGIAVIGIVYINVMMFRFFESYEDKLKLQYFETLKQQEDENYKLLALSHKQVREMKHDIENQLAVVGDLLRLKDYDSALVYLDKLGTYVHKANRICYTGNNAIDSIVNIKGSMANSLGIDFICKVNIITSIMADELDLCRIIGNALDNAIEGCERSSADKKHIYFSINEEQDTLSLVVTNSCDEVNTDLLTSSKKKSGLHGIGIGSIRSAAERLQGVSTFNYQDGIFTLRVVVLNC